MLGKRQTDGYIFFLLLPDYLKVSFSHNISLLKILTCYLLRITTLFKIPMIIVSHPENITFTPDTNWSLFKFTNYTIKPI